MSNLRTHTSITSVSAHERAEEKRRAMMRRRIREAAAVTLLVASTALVGACAGDDDESTTTSSTGDGGGGGGSLSVSGKEFSFDPSTLSASADTAFTVEFANTGTIEHDFTIEGKESAKLVAKAGSKASGSFTLAGGTYKFYCSVPGHEAAGMVGTITVE